jgi:hypothetical protein
VEKTSVTAAIRNQSRGQVFGFIIAMTVIVGGIVLIALGKKAEGLAAVLFPLAAIVGAFVYSELKNRQPRPVALPPVEDEESSERPDG